MSKRIRSVDDVGSSGNKVLQIILLALILFFIFLIFKGGYFNNLSLKYQTSYKADYSNEPVEITVLNNAKINNEEPPEYVIQFERTDNSERFNNGVNYTMKYVLLDERKVGVLVSKYNLKYFQPNKTLKVYQSNGLMTLAPNN